LQINVDDDPISGIINQLPIKSANGQVMIAGVVILRVSNATQSSHPKSNPMLDFRQIICRRGASHLLRMMQDFALSRRRPMMVALLLLSAGNASAGCQSGTHCHIPQAFVM
jgi:hypothetical protein